MPKILIQYMSQDDDDDFQNKTQIILVILSCLGFILTINPRIMFCFIYFKLVDGYWFFCASERFFISA